MTRITSQVSLSLDGFMAGPDQSRDEPLGRGGRRLHGWHMPSEDREPHPVDAAQSTAILAGNGAYVMGRHMFGEWDGPPDPGWHGWWGEEPPYHAPVFVLTHHARDPLEMQGGTTFHFVTDGLDAALARAREAAGPLDVAIAGGASTVRQALAAGHLDELTLHIAPVVLGAGERIFDDVGDLELEPLEATTSPLATHVRYRVGPPR